MDMTARKAARARLRDAQMDINTALDAIERGWVGDQLQRIYKCLDRAETAVLGAGLMLERGQERAKRRAS